MSALRASLIGLAAAAALATAGCQKDEQATTARSVQPLSIQTVSLMQEKGMTKQDPILLRIYKEESKAEVWKKRRSDGRYALLKTYDICRFSGKLGPKIKEGDKQAPEGFYSVGPAQMNPRSSYYLSFNIGFPNKYDQALGRTGQHLMVHGDCLSAGCYAMTDAQMAEIYALAREAFAGGQKSFQVQALPFRMTPENMARRRNNPNIAFWRNLKEGSDHFEVTKAEPRVDACGRKYVFNASAGPLSSMNASAPCPSLTVQPEIARAVAAKKRADDMVIAALSKAHEPAPEYVAQNGRLRRSLDEPLTQVAAAAPASAPAYAAAEAEGASTVALRTTTSVAATQPAPAAAASARSAAAPSPAAEPTAPVQVAANKAERGLFTRLFQAEEPAAPTAAPAAEVATASAARAGAPVPPARREVVVQEPVLASSVSQHPAAATKPASGGVSGWVRSVGGLFGGRSEEPAAAPVAAPATVQPAATTVSPAPRPRDRSARMPEQFQPKHRLDPRITSAFAAFD
ncbi:hypothetical protein ACFSCV_05190 [Methylopila henanensis]|uniref:L,D-TPase catalytic domain-containing protein n=1 Tax=Methylopila henanensis TaxID=873516 RepID=A0ABW4K5L0_9HYPH